MNTRRGVTRICVVFAVVWIPLVLVYPFYLRRHYVGTVRQKVAAFHELCVAAANGPCDEAVRARDAARGSLDAVNVVGAPHALATQALNAFLETAQAENKAKAERELATRKCADGRDKLYKEAFPPELNIFQWSVRPHMGRIWLLGDRPDPYLIEYLAADVDTGKLDLPRLPASVVFFGAIVLPPVLLYSALMGMVTLTRWIVRGFVPKETTRSSN